MVVYHFLVLTVITLLPAGVLSATGVSNPLNGQHLRLLTLEFPGSLVIQRNATGHVINIDGIQKHMIEALSRMLNFSYSFLPVKSLLFDDTLSSRGAISYLVNDEADYYLSTTVLAIPYRIQIADFPAYWIFSPMSTLLPYPKETENLAASFEPLSYEVWILIAISALTIALFLKMILRKYKTGEGINHEGVVPYVIGNLVSQGQRHFPNRLAVRVTAGAWCCTTFFLVQIYCCNLTSHLMSPNQKTLINSFFDIADTPGVSLTVDKGYALDNIMKTTESANVKRFADTLKKNDRLITCNVTSNCIEYVKMGKAVYSAPLTSVNVIMAADLKNTNSCHYTRTKETFWAFPAFTVLQKNSPYTESMSKGILRLHETGLLVQWEKWYVPSATKCLKINEQKGMTRLSIKHLSSAFSILVAGYLLSVFVFVVEKIISCHRALRVEIV